VYLLAEELFYIRLNGRICTKKKWSVPPSGRLISIRWNGSKNYVANVTFIIMIYVYTVYVTL
jgi:hypothetical protein